MTEPQGQEGGKLAVSPLGTFLIGLFLGAGILLTYHAVSAQRADREMTRAKDELARLAKTNRELHYAIASTSVQKPR